MLVWRKLASGKWEDAWVERLRFLGPERLAITHLANAKTIRIEAYDVSEKEARELVRKFAGQVRTVRDAAAYETKARDPIRIRASLVVFDSESARSRHAGQFPGRQTIVIPAAMAFGTGEHATTSQCLRYLCDIAKTMPARPPWEMLDLGTGSGILAIAARALGARRADAVDFDPHAIRTARENARLNGVRSLTVRKLDVLAWQPDRQWAVVAANLFSEVLIRAAPVIAGCVKAGGWLLLSGILRAQEAECVHAFARQHLRLEKTCRRGKWVTLAWHRIHT